MTPLLKATEVAKWLHVSTGWVFDHAHGRRQPILPCVKLGKAIRFRQDEVEIWLETLSRERAA